VPEHGPVLEKTVSRDGTPIGYWRSGLGPALVLVHGTSADASRWETARPPLDPHVTLCAMDRRGRGASGDGAGYRLEDEAADVAAVVDAIADSGGGPVDVLGHSYGALCALEAATALTPGIRRMVLYEPPLGAVTPPEFADQMAELLAQGRPEEVVISVLRDLAGMSADQLQLAMSLPSWPNRVAAAHTIVRETRAENAYDFAPERFASLGVPTLLLTGADTPPALAASTVVLATALPGARVVTMAGQGHVAMLTSPDLFATEVLSFLRGGG
jgi:pimeloyl-ACP methyl ester carboxylesterase